MAKNTEGSVLESGRKSHRAALEDALNGRRNREFQIRAEMQGKTRLVERYRDRVVVEAGDHKGIADEITRLEKELEVLRSDFSRTEKGANDLEIKLLALDVSHPPREVPRRLPLTMTQADVGWLTAGVHLWKAREAALSEIAKIDSRQVWLDETYDSLQERRENYEKTLADVNRRLVPIFRAEHERFQKFGPRESAKSVLKVVSVSESVKSTPVVKEIKSTVQYCAGPFSKMLAEINTPAGTKRWRNRAMMLAAVVGLIAALYSRHRGWSGRVHYRFKLPLLTIQGKQLSSLFNLLYQQPNLPQ